MQACERYTGLGDGNITGEATVLKEFTAHVNSIMRRSWHYIFKSQGKWEYDDANQTDLPQATTALVDAQPKYALPSEAFTIKRVEIKMENSDDWKVLTPLIRRDIRMPIEDYFDQDAEPLYYRLLGDTVELFPAPNYNQNASLKIYFDRGSVAFSSDDTTKTPGFVDEYHDLVPLGASLEWLKINLPGDARTAQFKEDYAVAINNLQEFYNKKFPAKRTVLNRRYVSYK